MQTLTDTVETPTTCQGTTQGTIFAAAAAPMFSGASHHTRKYLSLSSV